MDVEERHHREAAVVLRELESTGNGSRRGTEVPLRQRYELRASGRPGGVQQECRVRAVIGLGSPLRLRGADRAELEAAGAVSRQELEDTEPESFGDRLDGRGPAAVRHDDRRRAEIRERELELLLAVGRVERSAACRGRDAEERGCEVRAVGVDNGDTVARLDPCHAQLPPGSLELVAQRRVGQPVPVDVRDRDGVGRLSRPTVDELGDRPELSFLQDRLS